MPSLSLMSVWAARGKNARDRFVRNSIMDVHCTETIYRRTSTCNPLISRAPCQSYVKLSNCLPCHSKFHGLGGCPGSSGSNRRDSPLGNPMTSRSRNPVDGARSLHADADLHFLNRRIGAINYCFLATTFPPSDT